MLSVTVIILRLIVESVILLKDEDCEENIQKMNREDLKSLKNRYSYVKIHMCVLSLHHRHHWYVLTLSIFVTFCLRLRRLCLRMRCEEELRSVELLNL